jgi:N-acetylneuraminate synthase
MSTPFSVSDAKAVNKFVKIHKVASYEINHLSLLKFLAGTNKPIIVSTGASTYEKISYAIRILKKFGAKQIFLLQCTAAYPAPVKSLNLSSIPKLKEKFKIPVGFSDHSIDPFIAPLLAIGYGATIIEKHFTLNRKFVGPDHAFAIEPQDLKKLVYSIREADNAKGTGIKIVEKTEKELEKFATRSIQAIIPIQKGDKLKFEKNFELLRPGKRGRGADAININKINGKTSKRKIQTGDGIKVNHVH